MLLDKQQNENEKEEKKLDKKKEIEKKRAKIKGETNTAGGSTNRQRKIEKTERQRKMEKTNRQRDRQRLRKCFREKRNMSRVGMCIRAFEINGLNDQKWFVKIWQQNDKKQKCDRQKNIKYSNWIKKFPWQKDVLKREDDLITIWKSKNISDWKKSFVLKSNNFEKKFQRD